MNISLVAFEVVGKEDVMSCISYENVESSDFGSEQGGNVQRPRPYIVPGRREGGVDQIARRVAKVLDLELAQGSMPA